MEELDNDGRLKRYFLSWISTRIGFLDVTKSLLSHSGATIIPGVCTPAVDSRVIMHVPHHTLLSQLFCGFGNHIRVSSCPLFGRTTGRSRFACQQGLYVFFCIQSFFAPSYSIYGAALFGLQSARRLESQLRMSLDVESLKPPFSTKLEMGVERQNCR